MSASTLTVEEVRRNYAKLLDPKEPLDSRMRELYRLKEDCLKTVPGMQVVLEAVDTTDSVLLQHELAYNAGQSGREEAVPELERILRTVSYDVVTRHEAAEALGAIGSTLALKVLEEHSDPAKEPEGPIRETCELALARIAMKEKKGDKAVAPSSDCGFVSVDPSPAFNEAADGDEPVPTTVEQLTEVLLDTSGHTRLFRRYMAMFTLRNMANDAAVAALCRALREDTVSPLFRHEVAFVLGQMEHPKSQPALIEALKDEAEAPMVRHEAAEALGAIADPATLPVLETYAAHPEPIVRDSCVVALEMHKYWANFNSLGHQHAVEGEEKAATAAAVATA
ncbi:putative deoxyhypusine hydroxylase [Leptomonas pyrrhocoris]|uniref:Deoxyhypusine hydroxylase n=1 Tax=Leptomonas pyrrhocoris TaxID=157538 RepID=A0A0N0DR48_LEPPY|nr:putative deoxyhypusine hydroxylase [Leptomonas pyrrhocoris]XP_015652631.1 putative deoxyhypusine hydroxylase [Leptomonas pyrrhocoris]KPA74191.1 putative deoxyhypusine hydroxylase [Leptomonas pyrrhocoris]KPA74192.1 putative deoxyhypusine hydroxylase [Leptomonas pyrrhocoris]|eukprot:XP_015652630.1 putative deoxyhypusine hydroxylase [Leptomonas pyrrhocoris]